MDAATGHPVPHPKNTDSYIARVNGLYAEIKMEANPLQKGEGQRGKLSLSNELEDSRCAHKQWCK